ncbi:Hypothetical_protein [Hexamita inflata]|uniref:Hypothetical_protein n=1 Tax=Hexamita inflata TaxID=28002 RepID=A0AA86PEQ4_9EUKA|nr:Hypothetical protein HINF_LOCUS24326 [Hexamita inflata]
MLQRQQKQTLLNLFNTEENLKEREDLINQIKDMLKHSKLTSTNLVDQVDELKNNVSIKSAEILKLLSSEQQSTNYILELKQEVSDLQSQIQKQKEQNVLNDLKNFVHQKQSPRMPIRSSMKKNDSFRFEYNNQEEAEMYHEMNEMRTKMREMEGQKETDERLEREVQFIKEQMKIIMKTDTSGYLSELQRQILEHKEILIQKQKQIIEINYESEKLKKHIVSLEFKINQQAEEIVKAVKKANWHESIQTKLEQQYATNEILHVSDQLEIQELKTKLNEQAKAHQEQTQNIQKEHEVVVQNYKKEIAKFAGIEATHQLKLQEQRSLQKKVVDSIQLENRAAIQTICSKQQELFTEIVKARTDLLLDQKQKLKSLIDVQTESDKMIEDMEHFVWLYWAKMQKQ